MQLPAPVFCPSFLANQNWYNAFFVIETNFLRWDFDSTRTDTVVNKPNFFLVSLAVHVLS